MMNLSLLKTYTHKLFTISVTTGLMTGTMLSFSQPASANPFGNTNLGNMLDVVPGLGRQLCNQVPGRIGGKIDGSDVCTGIVDPGYAGRKIAFQQLKDNNWINNADECYAFVQQAATGEQVAGTAIASIWLKDPQLAATAGQAVGQMGRAKSQEICYEMFGPPTNQNPGGGVGFRGSPNPSYGTNAHDVEIREIIEQAKIKRDRLKMEGRLEEARIVNERILEVERLRNLGLTERAKLEAQTKLGIATLNSATEIHKANTQLEGIKHTNDANVIMNRENNETVRIGYDHEKEMLLLNTQYQYANPFGNFPF